MIGEPIPEEVLAHVRRKLCRRIGSVIVAAMAETDSSFGDIAGRLGKKEGEIRAWFYTLIDGASIPLDAVSDLCFAMGYVPTFHLNKFPAQEDRASPEEERVNGLAGD